MVTGVDLIRGFSIPVKVHGYVEDISLWVVGIELMEPEDVSLQPVRNNVMG